MLLRLELHRERAVLDIIMSPAQTNLLCVKRARGHAEVILDVDGPLDQFHARIVEVVSDGLDLLALELEAGVLSLLLGVSLINKLLKVVDLL